MAMLFERDLSQANKLGRREEIANLISLIDAKDTPFTTMARKGSQPQQTFFRWQVDSLPEPKTDGTVDGTDVTNADHDNYVKTASKQYRNELGTFIQIFRRSTRVSKLTQSSVTNIAGVKDELQNNVSKAMTLLKRDMEKTMCSSNNAAAEKSVTVGGVTSIQPYKTRGLDKWIVKAADKDTDETAAIVPDEFCVPYSATDPTSSSIVEGQLADLTETTLQDLLTSIYKQTGQYKTYDCLAGPLMKRAFTNLVFTNKESTATNPLESQRNFNRDASASTYTSSIDVFDGDFGQLRIHPSLFLKNFTVGYVIPFDLVEIRYGGNVAEITALPDYGGGPARLIEAVAALVVHNPLAFGKLDLE
jgi:Family of unknown function (DUF5309)